MTGDLEALDGCGLDFTVDQTPDGPWVLGWVLFAGVDVTDAVAVEARRLEWLELFGGADA